jgi:hypothetical protein
LQPLAPHGAIFVLSEQEKHQICPMNATQDAKQRNFVMDRQCLLHPFGRPFPIEAFPSSPPSSLSCEFIYLKNGEKFYKRKTNVEEKYCAVAESESFIGAPTTLCQLPELPVWLPAVLQAAGEQYCLQHTHLLQ